MRNLILAGAAGFALALTSASAFAIPRTGEIMSHSQMASSDQAAVGAFLPFTGQPRDAYVYAPSNAHTFGGEGADTGAGPGGVGTHN
jgi:hypothetical protein